MIALAVSHQVARGKQKIASVSKNETTTGVDFTFFKLPALRGGKVLCNKVLSTYTSAYRI
jgi:hypothetical protein